MTALDSDQPLVDYITRSPPFLNFIRKAILPFTSFVDWWHKKSGVPFEKFDDQRYFILSIHCTIWIRVSIILSFVAAIAMVQPMLKEYTRLYISLSASTNEIPEFSDMMMHIPPGSYLEHFIFYEVFFVVHPLLATFALTTRLPGFFIPSQLALIFQVSKIGVRLFDKLAYSVTDAWILIRKLQKFGVGIKRVYGIKVARDIVFMDNEMVPILGAMLDIMQLFFICFALYVVERVMQCYRYDNFVTNFKNYMSVILSRRKQAKTPDQDVEMFWIDDVWRHQTWCAHEARPLYDEVPITSPNPNATF
uniref:TLC domain-containing protein n=1 Tax=Panagrellus redivivus TaxID=6233 RepID=A0A7E4UW10_PANRE